MSGPDPTHRNVHALRGLYAIVDPCGSDLDPVALATDFLAGGARVLQLRWKDVATADLVRAGREIAAGCRRAGATLIVNDRVDVALAIDAPGVHLGQEDLPAETARAAFPGLLGISTHDVAQARAAERAGADYVGFGPMFPTETKETGYEARGLEALRAVRAAVRCPIVAIGGITPERARACREAGADAVAMISALALASDRIRAVRKAVRAAGDQGNPESSTP